MKKQLMFGIIISLIFLIGVSSAAPTISPYSGDEGNYRFVNSTDSVKLYFTVTDAAIPEGATITVHAENSFDSVVSYNNITLASPYLEDGPGGSYYVDLVGIGLEEWEYYNVSVTVTSEDTGLTSEPALWRVRTTRARATEAVEHLNTTAYTEILTGVQEHNATQVLGATTLPYTQVIGSWFWLIICALPFVYTFLATGRMSLPATSGIAFAAIGISMFPANFQLFAAIALVLSIGGAFYSLSKSQ